MGRFRPAKAGDVDAIVAMMRPYYEEDGYPFVESEARAAALALINEPHLGRLWVTCDGERVVGYVAATLGFSFEYRGREAFVDELFIAESHRAADLGAKRSSSTGARGSRTSTATCSPSGSAVSRGVDYWAMTRLARRAGSARRSALGP
jgi:hypothetical protein